MGDVVFLKVAHYAVPQKRASRKRKGAFLLDPIDLVQKRRIEEDENDVVFVKVADSSANTWKMTDLEKTTPDKKVRFGHVRQQLL